MSKGRIVYDDIYVKTEDWASAVSNSQFPFAQAINLKSTILEPTDFALLLNDYIRLDGSKNLISPDYQQHDWGWLSQTRTNSQGDFQSSIQLTIDFASPQRIHGLSFLFNKFDNSYATNAVIALMKINPESEETEYEIIPLYPDSYDYYLDIDAIGVIQIWMEFYSMNKANRFLWLQKFALGRIYEFGEEEIESHNVLRELHLNSDDCAINILNFSLILQDSNAIPFNQRRAIRSYYNNQLQGVFFVDDADRLELNKWQLRCYDWMGVLDRRQFVGDMYLDWLYEEYPGGGAYVESIRAKELVQNISNSAGVPIILEEEFKEMFMRGWIPICTCRQALIQVAFAIGAIIDSTESEAIYLKAPKKEVTSHFDSDRCKQGVSVKQDKSVITQVQLTAYNYQEQYYNPNWEPGEDTREKVIVFRSASIPEGVVENNTFISDKPLYGWSSWWLIPVWPFTKPSGHGIVIESTANWAKYEMVGDTLDNTAYPYEITEFIFQKDNPDADIEDAVTIKNYTGYTMVLRDIAEEVLNRCYDFNMRKETVKATVILEDEHIGDLVSIDTDYGKKTGHIISMDVDINNYKIATIEVRVL